MDAPLTRPREAPEPITKAAEPTRSALQVEPATEDLLRKFAELLGRQAAAEYLRGDKATAADVP